MKRITALFVLLVATFLAGCGGDSHASLMDEGVALTKELVSILDGVKDTASADAAASKVEALAAKGESLKKRMDAMGEPTEAQMKELGKKLGESMAQMMEMQTKIAKAGANPEVMKSKKLGEALLKFKKSMN